ncbi:MAG TPA: DMT family transporter, partial [Thermoanaerobaculia bacterium]|nr:DMT family transporter [Thermoanaerobaculia bacterium]
MEDSPPEASPRDRRPLVALLFVQLFFGTFAVLGKVAMREVSPFVLAAFRAVFGALLLTLIARLFASDESPPARRDRVTLALLSLFGVVANQTLYISGLSRTTATNATLLVSTIPVFTVLVGLVSGVERPTRLGLIGVLVALAGVVVLVNPGRLDLSD